MAYAVEKVDVWAGEIKDKPGAVAEKLQALSDAGANLEFVIARRDKPGKGVLFLAPLKGAPQERAAKKAKLAKAKSLHSVRVVGPDKPGLGTRITMALCDAGINLRGISAAALGTKCIVYFAFDSLKDANQGARVLKKTLKAK